MYPSYPKMWKLMACSPTRVYMAMKKSFPQLVMSLSFLPNCPKMKTERPRTLLFHCPRTPPVYRLELCANRPNCQNHLACHVCPQHQQRPNWPKPVERMNFSPCWRLDAECTEVVLDYRVDTLV